MRIVDKTFHMRCKKHRPLLPRKYQSLPSILQVVQHSVEMRRWVEVHFWIVGYNSMEISGNVRIAYSTQNVRNSITGAVIDVVVFEVLNDVCNQTALCHTEQIIQGFQSRFSIFWIQCSLASIFLVDSRGLYLFSSFPGHSHFVRVRQMCHPSSFLVHRKACTRGRAVSLGRLFETT